MHPEDRAAVIKAVMTVCAVLAFVFALRLGILTYRYVELYG